MKTTFAIALCCLAASGWGVPTVDLTGTWQVRLGEAAPVDIRLPGTLGDAGLGPAPTASFHGVLTPRHQYVGPATYTRTFTVPEGMTGACELFLERVLWKSMATIDGKELGSCDSLVAPHVHPIPEGLLTPGEHTLTVTIDNSLIHPMGEHGHCYGDSMQTRWNGAIGTLEIRPVNPLRQARVFAPLGDVATVELPEGVPPAEVSATIEGLAAERLADEGRSLRLRVPGARPWELHDPQLYTLTLRWRGQSHAIRFGFRSVASKGHALYLNGRPIFLRGNLDCCNFPLTGYPPTDKGSWLAILGALQKEGINQARFHSWTPPKAAFDAADELGMLVSPEILWIDNGVQHIYPYIKCVGRGPETFNAFIRAELFRAVDAYGNAPSFFSMMVGNELGGADYELMGKWLEDCRAHDNRRLYAGTTVRGFTKEDDFFVAIYYPGIGMMRNRYPEGTDWDYEDAYSRTKHPSIAHEIGQWPVYPLYSHELPKYEGILRAWNLENLRDAAAEAGVLPLNETFSRASLMTNRMLYKDEIESFLRTPSCAGFQLLSVQDYSGQGEALIGWFDSFYDPKPGLGRSQPTADYCAPVAHLARFPKHIWTAGETFTAALVVRNNGAEPLNAEIPWSVPALGVAGVCRAQVPVGAVKEVGRIALPLAAAKVPAQMELRFGRNRWPLWVYPDRVSADVPAGVTVTDKVAEARAALAKGGRVLLKARGLARPQTARTHFFMPVFWSTSWFAGQANDTLGMAIRADHPAFAGFPTEDWQDWQWRRLSNGIPAFEIAGAAPGFVPLAMPVPDFHHPALLGALFETAVGPGKLLVCAFDLDADTPEARQLRRSLLDYMASSAFAPKANLGEAALWSLFRPTRDAPAPRPEAYKDAIVYIACAEFLARTNVDVPWAATNDHAELAKGSYALAGENVRTWADRDGAYWVGDTLTVTLKDVTPRAGTLLVRFRDPNGQKRTAEGTFEGRAFKVPSHAKSTDNKAGEHWARLPIRAEDCKDGVLTLSVRRATGANVMIDRLIVMPGQ